MSYFADYRLAAEKAIEVLEDSDITQAPILLRDIIRRYSGEISVVSYTKFMRLYDKPYQDILALFDSDMGACAFQPSTNHYIIYYNDAMSTAWCRFTVAHELGHIFLGHHSQAGTSLLGRTFVPKADYQEYEKEANVFARNLLSPAPLAAALIREEDMPYEKWMDLQSAFMITEAAAQMRLQYLQRGLKDYNEAMKSYLEKIQVTYNPLYHSLETQARRSGIREEDIQLTIETVHRLRGD